MYKFQISSGSLTRFIRDFHADLLGSSEWGNGDSTQIHIRAFNNCVENVWGLGYLENFDVYNKRTDCFTFKVVDISRLKYIGLFSFGELIE